MSNPKNRKEKCAACGHVRYRHSMSNSEGNKVCTNLNCPCPDFKPQPTLQEMAVDESGVYIPPGSLDEPPRVQLSQKMLDDLAKGKLPRNDVERCEDCGHRRLAHLDSNYAGGTGACHHGSGCQCGWFVGAFSTLVADDTNLATEINKALDRELDFAGLKVADDVDPALCSNCGHARGYHEWSGSIHTGEPCTSCDCKNWEPILEEGQDTDRDIWGAGFNPQSPSSRAAYFRWKEGRGVPEEKNDPVNHPAHYASGPGPETIEVTRWLSFNRGNALKYIMRAGKKDPGKETEDLEKAIWYLNDELKILRGEVK